MKGRILLLEDDISLGETLEGLLIKEGYSVHWCELIKEATLLVQESSFEFDLAILDVGLPDGSGFEFSEKIKGVPFIFLTALNSAENRLEGYERGAHEYIPKPFHLRELLIRIERVLVNNRMDTETDNIKEICFDNYKIDLDSMSISLDGEDIVQLKLRDFQILTYLIDKAPRIISRDELLNEFWGENNYPSTRTIDNTIVRLRNIFGGAGDDWIKSIRSVGYQWNKEKTSKKDRGFMANLKFQNALTRTAQKVPPIWCMRQAGRYHQHYQKLKEKYTFVDLCKQPELAAETAMGPMEDFDFDIAILFSDILFPLETLGLGLEYNPGPKLGRHLHEIDLKELNSVEEAIAGLSFQADAVKCTRERLSDDKSLIGFIGGPWTLFTYAVEGAHKGHLKTAKTNFDLFNQFSEILIPLLEKNIKLQLDAGAEVVMILDTAAGEISALDYELFVAPKVRALIDKYPQKTGYYAKGAIHAHFQSLLDSPVGGFGFDHRWSLDKLPSDLKVGFFQGNFDQTLLFTPENRFKDTLLRYLEPLRALSPQERAGWVCGLGHGILPQTPENNVRTFVQTVREVFGE